MRCAAATSLPAGTGFIEKGVGYLPTGSCNGTNPTLTDFFVTVEVSSLGANQVVPYVYQSRTCDSAKFFPFLTAVFIVDKGDIVSITWDDECAFCNGEAQCQHNGFDNSTNDVLSSDLFRECGYTPAQCNALGGGGADCDLRVSAASAPSSAVHRSPFPAPAVAGVPVLGGH